MNQQSPGDQTAGTTPGTRGPCVCEQVMGHIQDALGVSNEVRQHLANSRIEFLKAIRSALDDHIGRLSQKHSSQGTKIAVE
jgi:hypothetical protein